MDDVLSLINRRQRQLLVHSFLYYQLDTSIISDNLFDQWAIELAELMREHNTVAKKSTYYMDFKDFDGHSGFDLPFSNPEIQNSGFRLLRLHVERKK